MSPESSVDRHRPCVDPFRLHRLGDCRNRVYDVCPLRQPREQQPRSVSRRARLRWKIEPDYKQLKGELGLDHYEGRSWLGWYHHTALVTAAHGFLTLERLNPLAPRPA